MFPKRLWAALVEQCAIPAQRCWSQIRKNERTDLIRMIEHCVLPMNGKATNKDEFVTAGGVDRRAIDWKRMAIKEQPGLYVAGECMDVDAITGGFNFQNAWTSGFMAANAIAEALLS